MRELIEAILSNDLVTASSLFEEALDQVIADKLSILKQDTSFLDEARIAIVKARIRGGKIQRRKKVSTNGNYTLRKKGGGGPKLIRMSVSERRNRRLGQKRGKVKRRAKEARSLLKRTRSMRKRKAIGL